MGCDGGTIPKRCELVREKKKPEQRDKDIEILARWLLCALSQLPLRLPIVACELGKLYNKESILEFLLDRSKFETAEHFSHIRNMKDVHTLRLTPNPQSSGDQPSSSGSSGDGRSKFICPISRCEQNGKHKFLYPVTCGCVFSERALRELLPKGKAETTDAIACPVCGSAFNYPNDVVVLNPEPAELEEAKKQMEKRRLAAKSTNKNGSSTKKKEKESSSANATGSKRVHDDDKLASKASEEKKSKPDTSKAAAASSSTSASTSKVVTNLKEDANQSSAVYRSLFNAPLKPSKPKVAT